MLLNIDTTNSASSYTQTAILLLNTQGVYNIGIEWAYLKAYNEGYITGYTYLFDTLTYTYS